MTQTERKPSAPIATDETALMKLWLVRLDTMDHMHKTDITMLNIMREILQEQMRQRTEHGFWWHIKAAFISLLCR